MARPGRQVRPTVAGALLIIGLAAVSVLIFFLDDIAALLRRDFEVVAVVSDAAGISRGSPVWIGGKEVGVVTGVSLLPTGPDTSAIVALDLELPRSVQSQVRADSRARLTSVGPVGARVVDILPGSAAAPALADGDTVRAVTPITPAMLTARARALHSQLDSVTAELNRLAPTMRARMQDTRRAFAGLELAMAEARRMGDGLDASPALTLMRDPAFTAAVANARAHTAALPALLDSMRARAGAGSGVSGVSAALARLQARADSLDAQLRAVAAMLESPNSSLARFRQDSALFHALQAASAELDSLIAEARRNPLRFVF